MSLPIEDAAEVRRRLLVYVAAENITYEEAASRAGLKAHHVYDFLRERGQCSSRVIEALCTLPIGLHYQPERAIPK